MGQYVFEIILVFVGAGLGLILSIPVELYFHTKSRKDADREIERLQAYIKELFMHMEAANPALVSRDANGAVIRARIPIAPTEPKPREPEVFDEPGSRVQWEEFDPKSQAPDDRRPRVYWEPALGSTVLEVEPPPRGRT